MEIFQETVLLPFFLRSRVDRKQNDVSSILITPQTTRKREWRTQTGWKLILSTYCSSSNAHAVYKLNNRASEGTSGKCRDGRRIRNSAILLTFLFWVFAENRNGSWYMNSFMCVLVKQIGVRAIEVWWPRKIFLEWISNSLTQVSSRMRLVYWV